MIRKLSASDYGRNIYYKKGTPQEEIGKVKNFDNISGIAWIVYACNINTQFSWERCIAMPADYRDLSF